MPKKVFLEPEKLNDSALVAILQERGITQATRALPREKLLELVQEKDQTTTLDDPWESYRHRLYALVKKLNVKAQLRCSAECLACPELLFVECALDNLDRIQPPESLPGGEG